MKKDNFDLRDYLVENKMTENSRGETRHHLGETVLDTRLFNTGLLVEMKTIDPDQDDPDFEADADRLDDMWDAQRDIDAGLNECGPELDLEEAGKPEMREIIDSLNSQFEEAGLDTYASTGKVFGSKDPCIKVFSCKEEQDDPIVSQAIEDARSKGAYVEGFSVGSREALIQWKESREAGNLEEAGYTDDDEDDWTDPDALGDDDGGASLLDLVGGRNDKGAKRAQKAAAMDMDPVDDSDLDTPAVPDMEDPEDSEEVPEDPEGQPEAPGAAEGNDEEWKNKLSSGKAELADSIEPLVDLTEFFKEHPNWKPAQLQRNIRTAYADIKEFGYPQLFIFPQTVGYGSARYRSQCGFVNPRGAWVRSEPVVCIHRPESVSQYGNYIQ